MKPLIFGVAVVFAFVAISAQTSSWLASPALTQVPIWPGRVPDPQPVAGPEVARAWNPSMDLNRRTQHS